MQETQENTKAKKKKRRSPRNDQRSGGVDRSVVWILAGGLFAAIAAGILTKLTGMSVIFLIQTVVVFLVPIVFGWVVLRTVLNEGNLLLLVPGSFALGCAALMLLLNELRFFLSMGKSLWFTYKILVILAIVLLLTQRLRQKQAPLHIPETFRSWYKLPLVLGTALVLTVYFGIPAFQGVLNDGWWFHYPNAIGIQTVPTFPLRQPFAPDSTGLYYHYGPGLLAASWSYLLNQSVQVGYALNIALFVPALFLMAIAFVNQVTPKFAPAYWAGVMVLLAGNLRFLFLLGTGLNNPSEALSRLNAQSIEGLLEMIFTPSHGVGIPFTLLLLILFTRFISNLSWQRGVLFGALLGVMTMIGAWYFALGFASCGILALLPRHRKQWGRLAQSLSLRQRWGLLLAPFAIAVFIGMFNNSYLAGYLRPYWLQDGSETVLYERIAESVSQQYANIVEEIEEENINGTIDAQAVEQVQSLEARFPGIGSSTPNQSAIFSAYSPRIIQPNLTPIMLNTEHFGSVPTMENSGSTRENWVPLFSLQVLSESIPVMLLGLPFGILLCYRSGRNKELPFLLTAIALFALLPPIFLQWGYRPIEFLRFFTVSFAALSVMFGWLIGELWMRAKQLPQRIVAASLAGICLLNPVLLGVIGLMPGTLEAVSEVSATAQSLSQVSTADETGSGESESTQTPASNDAASPDAHVFDRLAVQAGNLLFARTHGQERLLVMVPQTLLPPQEYFPDWLRLATLTRMVIPVGPYHGYSGKSLYTVLYEDAVTKLLPEALAGLDVRWIYLSSQYLDQLPTDVVEQLQDHTRFIPYARFTEGDAWVQIFRIL